MDSNIIFKGVSIFSWVLLLITGWMSFGVPKIEYFSDPKIFGFWLMEFVCKDVAILNSFDIYYVLFFMISIFTLILATAAFIIYMYSLFINKNDNVKNGMLGQITKFHFIPLLCISSLFIIGETLKNGNILVGVMTGIFFDVKKVHCAFNMIFDIIGLASLIYIYINTKISEPLYANFIIKKGVYSCFIALLVYDFFYVFNLSRIVNLSDDLNDDIEGWVKGCGYAFSILIGVVNICLSLYLKDLIIGFINLLMYIGMITYFFKISDDMIQIVYKSKGIGAIQIIMMILDLALISFLIIKYKSKLINSDE